MDTFKISGKILHKESGNGIPNLLVELLDLDTRADPESGSSPVILSAAIGPAADPTAATSLGDISALYKSADRLGSRITDDSGQWMFE